LAFLIQTKSEDIIRELMAEIFNSSDEEDTNYFDINKIKGSGEVTALLKSSDKPYPEEEWMKTTDLVASEFVEFN
jgi:hypothetical protein